MAYFATYGPNSDLDTRGCYLFVSMVHTVGHFGLVGMELVEIWYPRVSGRSAQKLILLRAFSEAGTVIYIQRAQMENCAFFRPE